MNAFKYLKKHWLWLVVNIAALVPLCLVLWNFAAGNIIDPVAALTNRTGYMGLLLLVLSVAITPLIAVSGWRKLGTVRKSLGLVGFGHIALHLLVFIGLDYGFNPDLIFGDALLTKRYIIVGFAAFLLLLPLAITSTKGWMKRLGKRWKMLHRLVYLAVPLGALHFVWVEKVPVESSIYGVIVGLLLLARVPSVRKRLNQLRQQLEGKGRVATTAQSAG